MNMIASPTRYVPARRAGVKRARAMRQHGMTLIEAMITLVLVGILAGVAYPGFRGLMEQVQYNQTRDALVNAFRLAKNEAIFRGHSVVVCASNSIGGNSPGCNTGSGANNWGTGWLVYEECDDTAGRDTGTDDVCRTGLTGEPVIGVFEAGNYAPTTSTSAVEFSPTGLVDNPVTFTITANNTTGEVKVNTANIVARCKTGC